MRQRAPRATSSLHPEAVTDDNALSKLIRERMADLNMTYADVAKAGGFPHHSTVNAIVNKREHRQPPRAETLRKLSKALQVPLDVVRAAAARSAGYQYTEITTTLEAADDTRIVVAHMAELSSEDRAKIRQYVADLANRFDDSPTQHDSAQSL